MPILLVIMLSSSYKKSNSLHPEDRIDSCTGNHDNRLVDVFVCRTQVDGIPSTINNGKY